MAMFVSESVRSAEGSAPSQVGRADVETTFRGWEPGTAPVARATPARCRARANRERAGRLDGPAPLVRAAGAARRSVEGQSAGPARRAAVAVRAAAPAAAARRARAAVRALALARATGSAAASAARARKVRAGSADRPGCPDAGAAGATGGRAAGASGAASARGAARAAARAVGFRGICRPTARRRAAVAPSDAAPAETSAAGIPIRGRPAASRACSSHEACRAAPRLPIALRAVALGADRARGHRAGRSADWCTEAGCRRSLLPAARRAGARRPGIPVAARASRRPGAARAVPSSCSCRSRRRSFPSSATEAACRDRRSSLAAHRPQPRHVAARGRATLHQSRRLRLPRGSRRSGRLRAAAPPGRL